MKKQIILSYQKLNLFCACILLFIIPLHSYAKVYLTTNQIYNELIQMENELSSIASNLQQAKMNKKGKFYLSGMSRFEFRYVNELKSPTNSVSQKFFFKHISSYEPNIKLNFFTEPTKDLYFNLTLGFEVDFTGQYTGNVKILNDFTLGTGIHTKYGNSYIKFGGPIWMLNTPLTFSTPGWFFRSIPFDRNSWDPIGDDNSYYQSLTQLKSLEQDVRSGGSLAIKGILLEVYDLPIPLRTLFFYGVTDQWYGKSSDLLFGNTTIEFLKDHRIGAGYKLMTINNNSYQTIDGYNYNYSVFADGILNHHWKYFFEIGYSELWKPEEKKVEDYGIIFNLSGIIKNFLITKETLLGLYSYYVQPNFVAGNSGIFHTTLPYNFTDIWYSENPQPDSGVVYNNRKGVSLRTAFNFTLISFGINWGVSTTLKPTGPQVDFPHSLDHSIWYYIFGTSETWSKKRPYNGALNLYWEGASENHDLKDTEKKQRYFDYIIVNAGLDMSPLIKRTYILFDSYFKSIENDFVPIPKENSTALLFGRFYDVFLAHGLFSNFFLISYVGLEQWRSTQTTQELKQDEFSYGFGCNYVFLQQTGLYFRFKRYHHTDFIRSNNDFYGNWYSIECKIYF